ncbi:MAG: 50S ribosomal protein L13 [Candidatus Pelagibacter sp.]|nr:50S ribosomal protein L13 [Candidatus Pelagibacter sp.]OUV97559.1 MAG: 50S ribosomal protein L13 [Candidatus Pelagibacter sp. TMED142]
MNEILKKISENYWLHIDATDLVVGRLAAEISKILRGKNNCNYTPNKLGENFVVITNAKKIKFTGSKMQNKQYFRHTGYPGGIKSKTPEQLLQTKPEQILKLAVKRMLPGGPLAKKQLTKLKIYPTESHPHKSQNLKNFDFGKLNRKNKTNN